MLALVLALIVLGTDAGIPDRGIPLRVQIGKTVGHEVGNANGWFCDDPSLIEAKLVTRDDKNIWFVTGKKAGTTQCRVGTDISRASYVFDVTVIPARQAARPG